MKYLIILIASICCIASSVYAEPTPVNSESEMKDLCDSAMKKLVADGSTSFLDVVASHWQVTSERLASYKADTAKNLTEKLGWRGKSLGYEFLFKKEFGNSLVGFLYLEKTEKTPILWFLSFYKPVDKWFFHSFYWNTQFEGYVFSPEK